MQNTYLSTFQSLGGLGLLLGTLGLAAVQLRNVLERRGELALLRAAGFRRRTLAALVLLENACCCGRLAIGVLAAPWPCLPHLLRRVARYPGNRSASPSPWSCRRPARRPFRRPPCCPRCSRR